MSTTKALLLCSGILLAASFGCTTTGGVSLRPDGTPGPQECPEEAKKAMRYMRLSVGDAAWVDLDANQLDAKRWYEAQPPNSEKFPICAVARLNRDQMRKLPESKPGMAILSGSTAGAYIVDAFR